MGFLVARVWRVGGEFWGGRWVWVLGAFLGRNLVAKNCIDSDHTLCSFKISRNFDAFLTFGSLLKGETNLRVLGSVDESK